MVKTKLKIIAHEDKTSNGFDYTRFKCEYEDSIKWMSAFKKTAEEKQTVEDLKNHENMVISVEVRPSKKMDAQGNPYLNLVKFYGKSNETLDQALEETVKITKEFDEKFAGAKVVSNNKPNVVEKVEVDKSKREYNPTTMYVSYAKDIYVASLSHIKEPADIKEIMTEAIELIKQAHEAFK